MNVIWRELTLFKRSGGWLIGMLTPLILVLCIGVTMTGSLAHVPVAIPDANSTAGDLIAGALDHKDFITKKVAPEKMQDMIVSGKIRAAIKIRSVSNQSVQLLLLIDSTDQNLKDQIRFSITSRLFEEFSASGISLKIDTTYLYHDYNFLVYLAPSILILGVLFGGLFIAGDTILNEKEENTLENVIVSGFSPMRFTMEKLSSFLITMSLTPILSFLLIAIIGGILPSVGELALTGVIIFLCSVVFVSFGIALSTYLPNRQVSGAVMGTIVFPLMFVSGSFLSVYAMKDYIIPIAKFNPLTIGTEALRTILLKHGSLVDLGNDFLYLLLFAIIFLFWALYRMNLVLKEIQE